MDRDRARADRRRSIEERRPGRARRTSTSSATATSERLHLLPTFVDGRPNPRGRTGSTARLARGGRRARRPRGAAARAAATRRGGSRWSSCSPDEAMLPAIFFIFSRDRCDEAVDAVPRRRAAADDRATSATAIRAHRRRAHSAASPTPTSTCSATTSSLAGLEAGVAAHHAGMVPPFKEAVEACFVAGPDEGRVRHRDARRSASTCRPASVVIEKLTKFTGEHHEFLTPGRVHPAHRAGRPARASTTSGYAVVLWSPFVPFDQVAALASQPHVTRSRSAFRPTYNMAANLVRTLHQPSEAHHLLNLSFAQYQADRDVVRARTPARAATRAARRRAEQARRPRARRRRRVPPARRRPRRSASATPARAAIADALDTLRPGDVVYVAGAAGRGRGPQARDRGRGGYRVLALSRPAATCVRLGPHDFDEPPAPVATIDLPEPFAPGSQAFRTRGRRRAAAARRRTTPSPTGGRDAGRAGELERARSRTHPLHDRPDLAAHAAGRGAGRTHRARGRRARTARRQPQREPGPAVRPRARRARGVGLRRRLGPRPTPGELLARLYTRATCCRRGAARRAARRPRPARARRPGLVLHLRAPRPRDRAAAAAPWPSSGRQAQPGASSGVWRDLNAPNEDDAGLPETRPPDPGFIAAVHDVGARRRRSPTCSRTRADRRRLRAQREAADRPPAPVADVAPTADTAATARGGRPTPASAASSRRRASSVRVPAHDRAHGRARGAEPATEASGPARCCGRPTRPRPRRRSARAGERSGAAGSLRRSDSRSAALGAAAAPAIRRHRARRSDALRVDGRRRLARCNMVVARDAARPPDALTPVAPRSRSTVDGRSWWRARPRLSSSPTASSSAVSTSSPRAIPATAALEVQVVRAAPRASGAAMRAPAPDGRPPAAPAHPARDRPRGRDRGRRRPSPLEVDGVGAGTVRQPA